MPNQDIPHTARNTYAYIEQGLCSDCQKPRNLYAHSGLKDLVLCCVCLSYKYRSHTRELSNLDDAGVETRSYQIARVEYAAMLDQRALLENPAPSPEGCASCQHPMLVGALSGGSIEAYHLHRSEANLVWEKVEAKTHEACATRCEECYTEYVRYNSSPHFQITIMNFDTYLGETICSFCVDAIKDRDGQDSFRWCGECNSYEYESDFREYCGDYYCTSCFENNVSNCEDCDTPIWSGNDHDCDENLSSLIHSYGYRPRPHFFGQGKYFLGFELEVESSDGRRKGAEYIIGKMGSHAYLKEDGSLNDGFEIVTHPHTLSEYQSNFDWTGLRGLSRQGFRSWDTDNCGLHIHVSRTAFGEVLRSKDVVKSQAHELRFIKLIYDNERQITRLAGRESEYAKFNDKGKLANRVKYGHQSERWEAVNSQNTETLEVRVFKGSLRAARVLSAIELVHASVEYTRDLKITGNNNALKWINFVRFVADNVQTYPNLVSAIQSTFDNDQAPNNQDND